MADTACCQGPGQLSFHLERVQEAVQPPEGPGGGVASGRKGKAVSEELDYHGTLAEAVPFYNSNEELFARTNVWLDVAS
jgi:hypothetical protein